MTDQTTTNAPDKAVNGTNGAAPAIIASTPAKDTPRRFGVSEEERRGTDRRQSDAFDGFTRFSGTTSTGSDARLAATTRMVNAFMGYLKDACGRPLDQMTDADVASLGQILGTVERLETRRSGH